MVAAALRHRSLTLIAFALSILAGIVIAARWPAPAQATSGGNPYEVPLVTDVDPDPNVVGKTITAEPAGVDIGGGITASAFREQHRALDRHSLARHRARQPE